VQGLFRKTAGVNGLWPADRPRVATGLAGPRPAPVDRGGGGWSTGPPWTGEGRAAGHGGGAMAARLQLAVAALRGTGNDGEGTGVLHGPRRARCACCGDRKRPGRTGRGEGRFGGGGGALELKRWRRL
jgi:hypothetical protein